MVISFNLLPAMFNNSLKMNNFSGVDQVLAFYVNISATSHADQI